MMCIISMNISYKHAYSHTYEYIMYIHDTYAYSCTYTCHVFIYVHLYILFFLKIQSPVHGHDAAAFPGARSRLASATAACPTTAACCSSDSEYDGS